MNCETAVDRYLASLTGDLDAAATEALESHLATCAACREATAGLSALWTGLEAMPRERPSEALRARFYAMLEAQRLQPPRRSLRVSLNGWLEGWWPRQPVLQFGLAVASLVVGLGLGPRLQRSPGELEALRAEIQSTRRLVTISMLQQQSPSQRLQGVSYSYQMHEPDADVIQALVETLDGDPNVNVRLAAADALGQFREQPAVRRNLMDSFQHQTSPLVQIALIDLLVEVRDAAIVELLQRVAQDPERHETVRQRAQWGLNRQL